MPLPSILKKASSYILGDCGHDTRRVQYHDGETLFCKNNVCVHPPSLIRQHCDVVHHPGYMTITCRLDKSTNQPNLHLSWIPNATLRKHPTTLANSQSKILPTDSSNQQNKNNSTTKVDTIEEGKNHNEEMERVDICLEVKEPVDWQDCEKMCSGGASNGQPSLKSKKHLEDKLREQSPSASSEDQGIMINMNRLRSESIDSAQIYLIENNSNSMQIKNRSMSVTSSCSPSTDPDCPTWMKSPELLALQHNLTFPESTTASPITVRRAHRCRRFSVDLAQMRSVRLFFSDPGCTSGQLVVASPESQYKIFHLHFGGLDKLASILHQWHQILYPRQSEHHQSHDNADGVLPYRHFMVCRPEISCNELHPEEGQVAMITSLVWKDLLNEKGQVEDDLTLRKGIFFGGCDPSLRKLIWPFLLHCYSYQSTHDDREQIDAIRRQEYDEIERQRCNMNPEEAEYFWRHVVCIVEKDVVRTDRANPYYAGEDNKNIQIMKNILLNYAVYNARLGYTQGMSDLLSPLLVELNCEIDAFWCFAGLMQRSITVCTPTDTDMDRNLCYLRELIKLMIPKFYEHLEKHTDALELLFCHRWILLCLKREFPTDIALVMWEACWSQYLTDYFHLFLCLAIMCIYADDVIAQDLRTDEMLLHFSSLAMYMDGTVVLRKARGLLYQFRQLDRLPCTLAGLCRQCGPGMWDSSHNPVIECLGHDQLTCPNAENYHGLKY